MEVDVGVRTLEQPVFVPVRFSDDQAIVRRLQLRKKAVSSAESEGSGGPPTQAASNSSWLLTMRSDRSGLLVTALLWSGQPSSSARQLHSGNSSANETSGSYGVQVITYEWRGRFDNDALNRLHAEGFKHRWPGR